MSGIDKNFSDSPLQEVVPESVASDFDGSNADEGDYSLGAQAYDPAENLEDDLNNVINDGEFDIDGNNFTFEEDRFTVAKPIWNDVKYALFFIVVFFIFIVMSMTLIIKHFNEYVNEIPVNTALPNSVFFELKTIFLIFFTGLISFGISLLIFVLAGKNSAKFTDIGVKFSAGFMVLGSISAIFIGQIFQGIIFGVISGSLIAIYFKYRPLVTLASNILQIVISVLKKYPATAIAALIGFFSSAIFTLILSLSISCAYLSYGFHSDGSPKYDPESGDVISEISIGLILMVAFLNFSGLYIIDVLKNVMHVTIGGIYGTWYYMESTFDGMPRNEGTGSFKRAMTYSFGSVCFGSLYVVLFQTVAVMLIIGGRELGFLGSIFNLMMQCTGTGVGYFNLYAYSFVALYGVPMMKSAKSTYYFFKQRGFQAILNDCIISASLIFYCVASSIFGVIITAIYLTILKKIINIGDESMIPLITFSFLLTLNITTILIQTVVSGSSVFFFALNKDPAVFQESHPFEFQEISRCYPKVLDKLNLNE